MNFDEFQADPLRFAALIAHQLQSPLGAVYQSLQTVLGEYTGPLSAQQRDSLEKASVRCNEAVIAVRRMLAIVKEGDDSTVAIEPAKLVTVLRQVHSQSVEDAARQNIEFTLETNVESIRVRMGESALTEVLTALVTNALKYTPDHGRVRLSVRYDEGSDIVQASVSDSGIGVKEEDRERVFEAFFRGPAAQESARPGVGLGLAFVKSVVTASGGKIAVTTSNMGGSQFTVELPVVEDVYEPGEEDKEAALRVVIIGGSVAGPKAAAKLLRLRPDIDLTLLDAGTVLGHAGCGLPYYVSGVVRDQKRLRCSPAGTVREPVFFNKLKNVHILNQTRALRIDRENKRVMARDEVTKRNLVLPYDKLLVATGSSPIVPKMENVELGGVFTLHGVRDAEGIKSTMAQNRARDVVIVGGGLLGVEMTEALTEKGARVTIVEMTDHILPGVDTDISDLVVRHLESSGVRIMRDTVAESLEGDSVVSAVMTSRGRIPSDLVILAVGVTPNIALAKDAGLELGETGAILTNACLQTSDPDIYAAGDCIQTTHMLTSKPYYWPMGSTANKQGRIAAINICGGQDEFPGIIGSTICKVFDYSVARTGLGEEEARSLGFNVITALVPGPDRAHFMPSARLLMLKLIVDRDSGRLLGVQATGPGGADKRIDTAVMAIAAGMTVEQVANADLCYAPPYASAMDNLITAANVVRNKLNGNLIGIKPSAVWAMQEAGDDFTFLDVRTPGEYDELRLPRSILIPLGSLRSRFAEIPREKPIVVFSSISLRAYEGALLLREGGVDDVSVMEGGIAMWPYETVG